MQLPFREIYELAKTGACGERADAYRSDHGHSLMIMALMK